jgi:hypothetical protein
MPYPSVLDFCSVNFKPKSHLRYGREAQVPGDVHVDRFKAIIRETQLCLDYIVKLQHNTIPLRR